jgi:hypothetical protein
MLKAAGFSDKLIYNEIDLDPFKGRYHFSDCLIAREKRFSENGMNWRIK